MENADAKTLSISNQEWNKLRDNPKCEINLIAKYVQPKRRDEQVGLSQVI